MMDWKAKRAARTKAEMKAGHMAVMKNMAQGIIDQIDKELGIHSMLVTGNDTDPRTWNVATQLPGIHIIHTESFWDFPTSELKAKVLLLRGKYGSA